MIVTIDGPAGAGKSSIARDVAKRLEFEFLDTGALYRAVTLGAIRRQIELSDGKAIVDYVDHADLQWRDEKVYLDQEDVSEEIRSPTVTSAIRFLADLPKVRQRLSELQRKIANGRDILTEGRDQGSEVFPNADCKIFLTATPVERAKRRQRQLLDAGRPMPLEEILVAQNQRDAEDRSRPVGALRAAEDAVVIESDGMSPDEVIDRILEIVDAARRNSSSGHDQPK